MAVVRPIGFWANFKARPAVQKTVDFVKRDLLPAIVAVALGSVAFYFLLIDPVLGAVSIGGIVLCNALTGHLIEHFIQDQRLQRHWHILTFSISILAISFFLPLPLIGALKMGLVTVGGLLFWDSALMLFDDPANGVQN
ncbi:MAG: hypothetical protein WC371_01020 [Parachlamydiales bacterium]|jgi:hypothetical protein